MGTKRFGQSRRFLIIYIYLFTFFSEIANWHANAENDEPEIFEITIDGSYLIHDVSGQKIKIWKKMENGNYQPHLTVPSDNVNLDDIIYMPYLTPFSNGYLTIIQKQKSWSKKPDSEIYILNIEDRTMTKVAKEMGAIMKVENCLARPYNKRIIIYQDKPKTGRRQSKL